MLTNGCSVTPWGGDSTLFAREDYVEEAWRIVDPVLKAGTPVYEYEPGTRGPSEVDQRFAPPGGWENPTVTGQKLICKLLKKNQRRLSRSCP